MHGPGRRRDDELEVLSQRILVIDSNVFFARRLTDALKAQGFDVTHVPRAQHMTLRDGDGSPGRRIEPLCHAG